MNNQIGNVFMRPAKIILIFGILLLSVVFIYCLPFLLPSPYLRFMRKDVSYFTQIAHACDSILEQHPVSAADSVRLSANMLLPNTLKISGHGASLPKILQALDANYILISSNRVFIEIGLRRMGGFGIIWEQDEMQTNHWTLETNGDGLVKVIYETGKALPLTFDAPN